MDIVSHGLWGGLAFGRKAKRLFWLSFLFGIAPDLLSFGFYTAGTWVGLFDHPDWTSGRHPSPADIPLFVHMLYQYTHSLVVFVAVFGIVWFFRRRPLWPLAAWGLHVLIDIPTHSSAFFPTPFLFPLSDFTVNGIAWMEPIIFFPNALLLVILYAVWLWRTRRFSGHSPILNSFPDQSLDKEGKI